MADITKLADSAEAKIRNGEARTRPDAARKAVRGTGIFHKPDVTRLSLAVCRELGRRGRAKQLREKDAQRRAREVHKRVAP